MDSPSAARRSWFDLAGRGSSPLVEAGSQQSKEGRGSGNRGRTRSSRGRRERRASLTMASERLADFLRAVPLFHRLKEPQFQALVSACTLVEFEASSAVCTAGDASDGMYIVEKGELSVYLPHPKPYGAAVPGVLSSAGGDRPQSGAGMSEDSSSHQDDAESGALLTHSSARNAKLKNKKHGKLVRHYTAGDFFGERSLLLDRPRGATIVADSASRLIKVTKHLFASVAFSVRGLLISAVRQQDKMVSAESPDARPLTRHVRQFQRLVMRTGGLSEMQAVVSCFSPELSVDDVIERLVFTAYSLFKCQRVGLFIIDHKHDQMVLKLSADLREAKMRITGIAGSVAQSGELENLPNVYDDVRFDSTFDKRTGFHTKSMLVLPIRHPGQDKVVAVLQLINKLYREGDPEFEDDDIDLEALEIDGVPRSSSAGETDPGNRERSTSS